MIAVEAAALRYIADLDAERSLRKARGACECEHVQQDSYMTEPQPGDLHPDGQPWAPKACWRFEIVQTGIEQIDAERYGDGSDRGWCPSCERRQRLHAELRAATKARVASLAKLRAAVRRGGA